LALAREANGYTFAALSAGLDRKAPWFQIKEDKAAAATSVYVILRVVDNLKAILAPILPHTAQELHEYLGYEGQLFGTQHVVEYEEETRSHQALTYDHTGRWAHIRCAQCRPGQRVHCHRGRRCVGRRRSSRSWMRAWLRRSTRGWRARQAQCMTESRGECPGFFRSSGRKVA
jgi:hypothetical protein